MGRQRLHELPVDSFVYENCSRNVDTFTEFCSRYATLTGEKMIYNREEDNRITFVRNEGRRYLFKTKEHPRHWENSYNAYSKAGGYYHDMHSLIDKRHTNFQGDACYGDAGGAVWKYWRFSRPGSEGETRTETNSEPLAVLTGVISRFEESCGTFYTG